MIEIPDDIDLTLVSGFLEGLKPDPLMTVSEWADAKRILPETSAEPGRFATSRTPYLKEIMDKLSVTDPAQKIVVEKGSQLGFTEAGNNWTGYSIDIAPAQFLFIMPTDALMKKTSKQRIEKMIDSTPELKAKVPKARGKDGLNTLLYKEYPGGFLTMIGANSPVGLSSIAAKNIYGDEIDRYPDSVGGEGSAVDLAETRSSTFGNRRKLFLTSTPTRKGVSQIHAEFEKTGQRYYNVPCPFCGEYQVLVFEQLKYEKEKYEDTKYECSHCKTLIPEYCKTQMLENGEWIPKFPEKEDGYTFGYHIGAIYSPYGMYSWAKMAKDHDDAQGNIPKLIVFTNTKLGECYEEQGGEKPDWEAIYDRTEDYKANTVFATVAFITAGVDVQADRLEIELVGWIKGKSSQSIDYRVLIGDTSQDEVWKQLSEILNETWERQGDHAIMNIRAMAVDTGYNTEKVYQFTQKHSTSRVLPVKGRDNLNQYISAPKAVDVVKAGKKIGNVKVWGVGVSLIKSEIYGFLKLHIDIETGEVPNGYMHLPNHRDTTYFRGLTAEEITLVTNKRGFDGYVWVKKYKRNEPLDCRVYARVAAYIIGMDRWNEDRWKIEADTYQVKQQTEVPKPIPRRRSSWWDPIN
jgi:phage terminase large subunit GpA-like protein